MTGYGARLAWIDKIRGTGYILGGNFPCWVVPAARRSERNHMKMSIFRLMLLAGLAGLLGCATNRPERPDPDDTLIVPVATNATTRFHGLLITRVEPLRAAGRDAGLVRLTVRNSTGRDIFLEVEGYEDMAYRLHKQVMKDDKKIEEIYEGRGDALEPAALGDNRFELLYGTGEGHVAAKIVGGIDMKPADLSKWAGAEARVRFNPRGYFRDSGQAFIGSIVIVVPVEE
jgi:hypothetical protein